MVPLPWLPSTNTNESDPPNTQQRYRLINLVAEDNAIEDTIYHLHRALNTGRVDLERFLRVRASFLSVFCVCLCTCVWWVWVGDNHPRVVSRAMSAHTIPLHWGRGAALMLP